MYILLYLLNTLVKQIFPINEPNTFAHSLFIRLEMPAN